MQFQEVCFTNMLVLITRYNTFFLFLSRILCIISLIVSCRSSFFDLIPWKTMSCWSPWDSMRNGPAASFPLPLKSCFTKLCLVLWGWNQEQNQNTVSSKQISHFSSFKTFHCDCSCQILTLLKLLLKDWICIPISPNRFSSWLYTWSSACESQGKLSSSIRICHNWMFQNFYYSFSAKQRNCTLFCFSLW